MQRHLANAGLDAAAGGLSAAFFNAVHRGLRVKMAASMTYIPQRGHPTALMVRTDLYERGLRTPQELRGHRIGLLGGLGTASSFYVGRMIRPLTFADVELIALNGGDQGVALARKSIAAAFAWNPFTQAFERKGIARAIALPAPGESTGALLFGERLLARPAAARAVFAAIGRAVADVSGPGYYEASNLAAYSKYIGLPAGVLAKDDRYDFKTGLPIDRTTLDAMQRLFIEERTLAYKTPVSDAQLVWPRNGV
jgi:ABC-type nitrate/sulfonate/bicarbonate transport system substrate-binding protein